MPRPFRLLTVDEFADLLAKFRAAPNGRRIDAVHMHHTFKPDHGDFRRAAGNEVSVIEGMFRFHTRERGFNDIAQHISIDPNGGIWTGRNFNAPPASATGHNGNGKLGPFMFETIGNFDRGRDRLEGKQLDTVLEVIALVQLFFGLPAEALRFHNQMSSKTCPGSAVRLADVVDRVREVRQRLKPRVDALVAAGSRGVDRVFAEGAYEVDALAESLLGTPRDLDPARAAVEEDDHGSPDEEAREEATWTEAAAEAPEPVRAPQGDAGRQGRRLALCIGIDRYPTMPLNGCVADAKLWAGTLRELGFEVQQLLNEEATRERMLDALRELVDAGRSGDVLVFQYAGHGTRVRDREESDEHDEALVAVDYEEGGIVLDDEQFEVYSRLRDGVNLTCFYDCCHSGSAARMALSVANALPGVNARPRFMPPTPAMQEAYARLRGGTRAMAPRGENELEDLRAVVFSACQDPEFAMEVNGQGVFTGHAVSLLPGAVAQRVANQAFHQQVVGKFGTPTNQNPNFEAASRFQRLPLLQPLTAREGSGGGPTGGFINSAELAQALRDLADRIQPPTVGS